MDREKIERRDFPTGRRGYDPAAVDEHLRRVADEFEAQVHPPAQSLSSGASEQVRQILVAAEHSATELRAKAGEEASDHVARVREAADGMLAHLDDLEQQLAGLLEALRTAGERLTTGLAALQAEVSEGLITPGEATESRPAAAADSRAAAPPGAAADSRAAAADSRAAAPPAAAADSLAAAPPAAAADSVPPGEPVDEALDLAPDTPLAAAPLDDPDAPDEAGARLIALNMALSGSSRDDTARYLADHFALADPAGLLDDVYERAGR